MSWIRPGIGVVQVQSNRQARSLCPQPKLDCIVQVVNSVRGVDPTNAPQNHKLISNRNSSMVEREKNSHSDFDVVCAVLLENYLKVLGVSVDILVLDVCSFLHQKGRDIKSLPCQGTECAKNLRGQKQQEKCSDTKHCRCSIRLPKSKLLCCLEGKTLVAISRRFIDNGANQQYSSHPYPPVHPLLNWLARVAARWSVVHIPMSSHAYRRMLPRIYCSPYHVAGSLL